MNCGVEQGDNDVGLWCVCVSCRSHGLHGAWQRAGGGGRREEGGPAAEPWQGPDPQTGGLEEETPTAPPLPQGAHAILEQGEQNRTLGHIM